MTTTTVRERPILFSAEMVRALLRDENPKTQTRRVIIPQPEPDPRYVGGLKLRRGDNAIALEVFNDRRGRALTGDFTPCPYGQPGDLLWVRESWQADMDLPARAHIKGRWWHEVAPAFRGLENVGYVYYRADDSAFHAPHPDPEHGGTLPLEGRVVTNYATRQKVRRWLPSIHMPRWASRITLEITEVRVECIQAITDEECWAEGIDEGAWSEAEHYQIGGVPLRGGSPERCAFAALWDRVNAARGYGWDANPWVWVISFRRVEVAHA